MANCRLRNPQARRVAAQFWKRMHTDFPDDARVLAVIVRDVVSFPPEELAAGTLGHWKVSEPRDPEESLEFFARHGSDHGMGYGTLELSDGNDLELWVVAHEMGYAFALIEDSIDRCAPSDEWASEAAADMHAVRWGVLTCEDMRHRDRRNVGPETIGRAGLHHGPPPGGDWIEDFGARWRLREDFVFETADA